MTADLELVRGILRGLAFVLLYFFIGFGPGFVFGIVLANWMVARGKPNIMEDYDEAKKLAAQHNSQWHPDNERWQG